MLTLGQLKEATAIRQDCLISFNLKIAVLKHFIILMVLFLSENFLYARKLVLYNLKIQDAGY